MDYISDWVKNIIIISTFLTLLEIILPNGNIKKYVDVLIALTIIIVIINPLIYFLSPNFNLKNNMNSLYNINEESMEYFNNRNDINDIQKEQVIDEYISYMEIGIKEMVKNETNYEVVNIDLSLKEDKNYKEINSVSMTLKQKDNKEDDENIIINKIETVSIDGSVNKDQKTLNKDDENTIKNLIKERYNVPEENIFIYVDN